MGPITSTELQKLRHGEGEEKSVTEKDNEVVYGAILSHLTKADFGQDFATKDYGSWSKKKRSNDVSHRSLHFFSCLPYRTPLLRRPALVQLDKNGGFQENQLPNIKMKTRSFSSVYPDRVGEFKRLL